MIVIIINFTRITRKMSMEKLYRCIEEKNVNNSQAREVIYAFLMKEGGCLSVSEIISKLLEESTRKISLNTIYRHLTFFTECGLVMVIQDDHKKAYYCLSDEKAKAFAICPKCNYLKQVKGVAHIDALLESLECSEFITIHKKCDKCK